ncbi:MAG: hypothetical protein ACTHQQ_18485, partial [Solirubrobacteraceae bacterium]
MDFEDSPSEAIAETIAREIGREVDYRPAESDGARRAATIIAGKRAERTLQPVNDWLLGHWPVIVGPLKSESAFWCSGLSSSYRFRSSRIRGRPNPRLISLDRDVADAQRARERAVSWRGADHA